jgi:hypothetical protein
MADPIDPDIELILEYCGFEGVPGRLNISIDGFGSFDDILSLTEKDIGDLAKGFAGRTVANGRIVFGLRRTKYLKATIHWCRDFRRISRAPSLDDIEDRDEFREAITVAEQRAQLRKHRDDDSDALSKSSTPGKLKRQKDWQTWQRSFINHLSTQLGHDGVPLSYVARDNVEPDYEEEDEEDSDFEKLCIATAPLTGLVFKTDARKVHQLIHSFVQGEAAETWIKPIAKRQNGRITYFALKAHYGGEGNKSVRISEAEGLRTTLIYRNERQMSFDKFLTSMQTMFTGFEDNDEFLSNAQKIRLLFQKVQAATLEVTKSALQVQSDLDQDGDTVTYDFIANSMSVVAEKSVSFAENRRASGVATGQGGEAPSSGINKPDGSIFTGYFKNFQQLSSDDKSAVIEERKRLNITPKKGKPRSARKTAATKATKGVAKFNRAISSLTTRLKELEGKRDPVEEPETEVSPQDNAGDQFGGRRSKKTKGPND